MPAISGVGDGAYGMTSAAGRSIVNAYSNGSRTLVAAQANGSLASVEALARPPWPPTDRRGRGPTSSGLSRLGPLLRQETQGS